MEILIKVVQLILSLSILIILHELGHFIPAKLFKTRVERFFLFFDPWFALFKKRIGSTVYGIGWLPLGGYVKISGMIDESLDTKQIKRPPQPWKFRSKPAWQRLIIMLGGVVVNALLAIVIFSWLLFQYGETYLPVKNMKYGIAVNAIGSALGLENGDIIRSVDGKEIERFEELPKAIVLGQSINLERNEKNLEISLRPEQKKSLFDQKTPGFFLSARAPAIVEEVIKQSGAEKAGLKKGDKIIGIDSQPTLFTDQIFETIPEHKNGNVMLSINRDGDLYQKKVEVDENGHIGMRFRDITKMPEIFQLKNKKYSLLRSIPAGAKEAWESLNTQLSLFKQIFNPKTNAYKQVGSFFSITKAFSPYWNWKLFWTITATLSIWLAFLNLLPIPALDGGYVLFTLTEMITGKKPGEKFMERAITAGFIFLAILMIIILSWDTFKTFFS
ncbi:RIP metalloprotease RseP [Bacteroidetes bacterium endosymbiont of Geopemphigus sp.]|uniref:RIP metalloprotease RseP n=1 Tax=Bacteroidetes bacterium endosymbiont of Geopemphigus sp. TaxID=2047937 RepID=UPI000CD04F3B|nr:RIP metalloprotease RseP [Bacteroidetes bacterium endosymbiont of Geopemphigus sp.]